MNHLFGFIVGLLQSALALLGFVQVHPDLPQPAKDQATQVAQQAITQATQALATNQAQVVVSTGKLVAAPTSGVAPLTVHFSLPGTPYEPGNAPLSCRFHSSDEIDFGDGTQGIIPLCGSLAVDHTYSTKGTYKVTAIDSYCGKGDDCPPTVVGTATITVTGISNPSQISVPGMSKYTDADFGFTFWYPSGWTVQEKTPWAPMAAGNAQLKKELTVASTTNPTVKVVLREYGSEDKSISFSADTYMLTYYFDSLTHTWMQKEIWSNDSKYNNTRPADVRPERDTMGGLHMLIPGGGLNHDGERGDNVIIPLSAHNFVDVFSSVHDDYDIFAGYLARTIVATDQSVATPWDNVAQTKVVGYERERYKTGAFYMGPSGHAQ